MAGEKGFTIYCWPLRSDALTVYVASTEKRAIGKGLIFHSWPKKPMSLLIETLSLVNGFIKFLITGKTSSAAEVLHVGACREA
jgi:hypothetical protein